MKVLLALTLFSLVVAPTTKPSRGLPGFGYPWPEASSHVIISTLASPALEGRGVGTAGIDSAASYIAHNMAVLGLLPGGENGSYFQPFEVTTGVEVGRASCRERVYGPV